MSADKDQNFHQGRVFGDAEETGAVGFWGRNPRRICSNSCSGNNSRLEPTAPMAELCRILAPRPSSRSLPLSTVSEFTNALLFDRAASRYPRKVAFVQRYGHEQRPYGYLSPATKGHIQKVSWRGFVVVGLGVCFWGIRRGDSRRYPYLSTCAAFGIVLMIESYYERQAGRTPLPPYVRSWVIKCITKTLHTPYCCNTV